MVVGRYQAHYKGKGIGFMIEVASTVEEIADAHGQEHHDDLIGGNGSNLSQQIELHPSSLTGRAARSGLQ